MADLYDFVGRIPAVDTLGIQIFAGTPTLLRLPMAGNTNHHGTVFGGSLSLFATLAGWVHAHECLPKAHGDIVIKKSQLRYLAPAKQDVWAIATSTPTDITKASNMLSRFGRGSLAVTCTLWCMDAHDLVQSPSSEQLQQGTQVAEFVADFVAMRAD